MNNDRDIVVYIDDKFTNNVKLLSDKHRRELATDSVPTTKEGLTYYIGYPNQKFHIAAFKFYSSKITMDSIVLHYEEEKDWYDFRGKDVCYYWECFMDPRR